MRDMAAAAVTPAPSWDSRSRIRALAARLSARACSSALDMVSQPPGHQRIQESELVPRFLDDFQGRKPVLLIKDDGCGLPGCVLFRFGHLPLLSFSAFSGRGNQSAANQDGASYGKDGRQYD